MLLTYMPTESSKQDLPTVWRTKLRSTILTEKGHRAQVKYCLDNSCVGFGWAPEGVTRGHGEKKLDEVTDAISSKDWKNWGPRGANRVRAFAKDVNEGDYIWVRDTNGRYLLGKFKKGDWRYEAAQSYKDLDLHQLRPVDWAPNPLDPEETPGGVVRAFTGPGQVFRRIKSPAVGRLTHEFCWETMNNRKAKARKLSAEDAVEELAPEELEDLVLLWLQFEGDYALIPSSRQRDLPIAEATLINRKSFKRARPQVKSGDTPVNWDELGRAVSKGEIGIGFAASNEYEGSKKPSWKKITIAELANFATSSTGRKVVPERIRFWFDA